MTVHDGPFVGPLVAKVEGADTRALFRKSGGASLGNVSVAKSKTGNGGSIVEEACAAFIKGEGTALDAATADVILGD